MSKNLETLVNQIQEQFQSEYVTNIYLAGTIMSIMPHVHAKRFCLLHERCNGVKYPVAQRKRLPATQAASANKNFAL